MLENANKLGSSIKMCLLDNTVDTIDRLNLLVQITAPFTEVISNQMGDLGAEIRTRAGDVLTITLPANQLQQLAALASVVYIELSAPLSTDLQKINSHTLLHRNYLYSICPDCSHANHCAGTMHFEEVVEKTFGECNYLLCTRLRITHRVYDYS
ncbi:MAG: hypothetical protein GY801_36585 [bacterium]|nr:hypothetical protein [bacterium]